MLSGEQKKTLLMVARRVIEAVVQKKVPSHFDSDESLLLHRRGCFVTIHNQEQLRGCIGSFIPSKGLLDTVVEMAEAATNDSRFIHNPITPEELPYIDIEISVLSELEKTNDPMMLELGVHGVYIISGQAAGCFLPQVATETGWSKEEFLGQCCAGKGGMPWDAWKDPATEVYLFTAEVFGEKDENLTQG